MSRSTFRLGLGSAFPGQTARQTLYLYVSYLAVMLLGVVNVTVNTRILGPMGYGVLSFFMVITEFVGMFFSFGFFNSGSVLVAQEENPQRQKEVTGALSVLALVLGVGLSIFFFGISFFIDRIFRTQIGDVVRRFSALLIAYPLPLLIGQVAKGTNRIPTLSLFNVAPKVLYVGGLSLLLILGGRGLISVKTAVLVYLCSGLAADVLFLLLFRPSFKKLRTTLGEIWELNRHYGIHLYLGQITDKSTYKLDGIFIPLFVDTVQLGFYTLATTLTAPIQMLSESLCTSLFQRFVKSERAIPKKISLFNLLWLISSTTGVIVLGGVLVTLLFGKPYDGVKRLIIPLALARLFQGLYQPHNSFLAAKEKGKWLRNISILQSVFNFIGNFLFIFFMGALGAAIASMIAAALAYGGYVYYYRQYGKENEPFDQDLWRPRMGMLSWKSRRR